MEKPAFILNDNWKYILFLNRPWPVRIWMWSAMCCVGFYLIKFSIIDQPIPSVLDMVLMAYGLGSIGVYVLVYEFDWS